MSTTRILGEEVRDPYCHDLTMSDPTGDENERTGRTAAKNNIPFRLWFDDGSIVLVAQGTAFRVHASLISRHSPAFKKLFAMPRTSEAEHLNGCPVFHLSDTAEDMDYLLELIYDGPWYAAAP